MKDGRKRMIARAVKEIKDGMNVNLGIGMPTLVANEIPEDYNVLLQSENGLLGIGPYPLAGAEDPDLINAGKEIITEVKGASYFDSAESFAMIRGGHIDVAILGGMEVSEKGDLANWMIPGKMIKGMGGAMDLVHGAKRIVVIMEHVNKFGESQVVHRLITDLAVFEFHQGRMMLTELQEGASLEEVIEKTEGRFTVSEALTSGRK
ncbi:3-oxoacid CoA-transferase subunit B [Bacillus amyloliquefaciens]|uniref:3-oxoacid CoA-transferase subunit B n=1 Tax=Bacillus amyloliquefaciens TaxID=1390 RepID=UPI0037569B17